MTFLDIRFLDVLDIILVAYILYQVYTLIKGTVALNIFIGIIAVYLIWLVVRASNMKLLGSILGQVMGVGVIALIVVFQQEIRRFLLYIGSRYFSNKNFSIENLFARILQTPEKPKVRVYPIVKACLYFAKTKTGALIVIENKSGLYSYIENGEKIDALTSCHLLETIFFKNTPLHDGAVIISGPRIVAARCVLPVSESLNIPKKLGLRHRSALGISENSDALVIVVSEETGFISYCHFGKLHLNITATELRRLLENLFIKTASPPQNRQKDEVSAKN